MTITTDPWPIENITLLRNMWSMIYKGLSILTTNQWGARIRNKILLDYLIDVEFIRYNVLEMIQTTNPSYDEIIDISAYIQSPIPTDLKRNFISMQVILIYTQHLLERAMHGDEEDKYAYTTMYEHSKTSLKITYKKSTSLSVL